MCASCAFFHTFPQLSFWHRPGTGIDRTACLKQVYKSGSRKKIFVGNPIAESAKGRKIKQPKTSSEVEYGEGCPLPIRLGVLGNIISDHSWKNAFWHISKATERSISHLHTDALSSSNSVLCHIWVQGRRLGEIALPSLPHRKTVPRYDKSSAYFSAFPRI